MSFTEVFSPIYQNVSLQGRKLEDKAVRLYTKFVQNKDTYLSLAAAKKNFRDITSQEVFICVAELEKMGYLVAKIDKARLVYKFNDGTDRTNLSVPLSKIDAAQKLFEDKIERKIERARKVLEKYQDKKNLKLDKQEDQNSSSSAEQRTAMEIHEQDHVPYGINDINCRPCQLDKGTFGISNE